MPEVSAAYWAVHLPWHWVVEAEGELWAVPAVYGGWADRERYRGPREALYPFSRRTERIIRRLLVAR